MNRRLIFAAAGIILLTACSKSDNVVDTTPVKITAGLNGTRTRANNSFWNSDVIGVSITADTQNTMTSADNTNVQYSTTSTEARANFSAVGKSIIFNASYTGNATFAAYAPYSSTLAGNSFSLNTLNNNNTYDDQEKNIDILFAGGATASYAKPEVLFDGDNAFSHKMVQLNLTLRTVQTSDLTADLSSATAINLGGLIHEGTFNITDGTVQATGAAVADWNILNTYHVDEGSNRTYTLILLPQQLTDALTLSVTIQGKTYVNRTIKPDMTVGGRAYNYVISVQGNKGLVVEGSTITSWDKQTEEQGNAYQETTK